MKSAWGRKEIKKEREREEEQSSSKVAIIEAATRTTRLYSLSIFSQRTFFSHREKKKKKYIYLGTWSMLSSSPPTSRLWPLNKLSRLALLVIRFLFFIRPLFFFLLENGRRRKRRNFFLWRPNQVCACINSSWERGRKGPSSSFCEPMIANTRNLPSQGSWHNKLPTGARYWLRN